MKVKKGSQFSLNANEGLREVLHDAMAPHRHTEYKNISAQDKKNFEHIIGKVAKQKPLGSKFTHRDRVNMYREASILRDLDKISDADLKDFKRIVDQME